MAFERFEPTGTGRRGGLAITFHKSGRVRLTNRAASELGNPQRVAFFTDGNKLGVAADEAGAKLSGSSISINGLQEKMNATAGVFYPLQHEGNMLVTVIE